MVSRLCISNQKGGVGKSTICIQTAFYLTQKLGLRVLVIDMDSQGNTSSRLAPRSVDEAGRTTYGFTGTRSYELFSPTLDKEITVTRCPMGMDLIHAIKNDTMLSDMEAVELGRVVFPAKHLKEIEKNYDYVLIDCPPAVGRQLVAALIIATHVVCPIKLSGFAVDGVEGLLKTILATKRNHNENLSLLGLFINDMDRSVNHAQSQELLESQIGGLLLKNKIMHRPPLDRATTLGIPIWELPYGHVASGEVIALIEEIIEKINN